MSIDSKFPNKHTAEVINFFYICSSMDVSSRRSTIFYTCSTAMHYSALIYYQSLAMDGNIMTDWK